MPERVVKVKLSAQVADFNKGMQDAANKTRTVGTEAERLAQKKEAFNTLGVAALGVGTAMTAMTVLSVKAAMDWETAWTGVTKTVEGTPEQLERVETGLRDLTGVLPATHDEIAAVAEAAGQLGIQTDNVVSFTKTMIDLGETTNLSADQAATSLARFTNIMGTSQDQVSNLGSAIVGLGNNYATTEAEILEMAMRLAGAGRQIGLSEGDVLGLSTALSSVGIEAEAGGSAFSKVMIDIAASVDEGGDRLDKFASIAGVSADEFANKWRTAPSEALSLFVKGLSNAEAQGSSTLGVLADLGITEVRMRDALLRSSSAADMFTEAMQQGNTEFEANNALTAEAAKRYSTVESRVAIAGNAVRDAAIDFGEVFLPAVGAAADGVAQFAGFMGDLPDPVQGTIGVLTGLVGVTALVGGTALLAVPKIAELRVAMDTMNISGRRLAFIGGGVTIALTALVTAIGAVAAAQAQARQRAEDYVDAIGQGADAVHELVVQNLQAEKSFLWMDLGSAADNAEQLGISLDLVAEAAGGNKEALAELNGQLDQFTRETDAGFEKADKLNIPMTQAIQIAQRLRTTVDEQNQAQSDANRLMEQASEVADDNAESTETAAEAYMSAADEVSNMDDQLVKLIDTINEANGVGQDAVSANLDYKDALAEVDDAIAKAREGEEGYALTLDDTTQAGRDNMEMLLGVAESAQEAAQKQFELDGNTANYRSTLEAGREALIRRAMDLGYNADQAQALADKIYAIPDETEWEVIAKTNRAEWDMQQFIDSWSGRTITVNAALNERVAGFNSAGGLTSEDGNIVAYENGGFPTGIYAGRPGGMHKFAEPQTGWEAYISGKPSQRERNVQIWQETGERLGAIDRLAGALSSKSGGGDTYVFNGQYAMTADELSRAVERDKRRRVSRTGSLTTSKVT